MIRQQHQRPAEQARQKRPRQEQSGLAEQILEEISQVSADDLKRIQEGLRQRISEVVNPTAFASSPTQEDWYWGRLATGSEEDFWWRRLSDNWYQKDVIPSTYLEKPGKQQKSIQFPHEMVLEIERSVRENNRSFCAEVSVNTSSSSSASRGARTGARASPEKENAANHAWRAVNISDRPLFAYSLAFFKSRNSRSNAC